MKLDPLVLDDELPEPDLSDQRVAQLLGDIKRNSRNRRIALFAPVVLAAAVIGAMLAAPPQHGGLALVSDADAEAPDPELPRVFGSNGVWRLAEPIEDAPVGDPGPADVIEAPTEPTAPAFTLSPPEQEELTSLPASTSTPPTSTSGQSLPAADTADEAERDWSRFTAVIRIETGAGGTDDAATTDSETAGGAAEPDDAPRDAVESEISTPDPQASAEDTTPHDPLSEDTSDDRAVAVEEPQTELTEDPAEANPSTPPADPADAEVQSFTTPATIVPQSVLVYGAHVSVTVQVVDDDSSVIDWCNTRVDWGDGSVSRVAGADDATLCTASCEYESTSSASGDSAGETINETIDELVSFEHSYSETIDAAPRIFIATGDGCSYTLAELELPPFTVVPLP